jgi:hypothetical protein
MPQIAQATESYYIPRFSFFTYGGLVGAVLEGLDTWTSVGHWLPGVINIFASAGNLWPAFLVGCGAVLVPYVCTDRAAYSRHQMRRLRRRSLATTIVITGLINCATETAWGVAHLPIARLLNGTTPDPLDLGYSVLWSAMVVALGWRQIHTAPAM